jgi:hypothetical protein
MGDSRMIVISRATLETHNYFLMNHAALLMDRVLSIVLTEINLAHFFKMIYE